MASEVSILEPDEQVVKATELVTSWMSKNHPDLDQYLLEGSVMVSKKDDQLFFVSLGVRSHRGYQFFGFWVNLIDEAVEPSE